jgi:hypothetical protein
LGPVFLVGADGGAVVVVGMLDMVGMVWWWTKVTVGGSGFRLGYGWSWRWGLGFEETTGGGGGC